MFCDSRQSVVRLAFDVCFDESFYRIKEQGSKNSSDVL